MARLLYVEASPRKERSASIEAAKTFINEYGNSQAAGQIGSGGFLAASSTFAQLVTSGPIKL